MEFLEDTNFSLVRKQLWTCLVACGGLYTSLTDSFSSPLYPSQYPPDQECIYIINATDGYRITLTFVQFQLQAGTSDCNNDFLQVCDYCNSCRWKLLSEMNLYVRKPISLLIVLLHFLLFICNKWTEISDPYLWENLSVKKEKIRKEK